VYDAAAVEVLANIPKTNFIVLTPVYSTQFFSSCNVFNPGNVWDFRCVITDQASVYRAGVELGVVTTDTLVQIKTPSDLWPQVVRDNGKMIGFLMAPRTSYHSSMNLLQRIPKSGALQQNSDGIWEFATTAINDDNDQYVREDEDEGYYEDDDVIVSDDEELAGKEEEEPVLPPEKVVRTNASNNQPPGYRGDKERVLTTHPSSSKSKESDIPLGDVIREDEDLSKSGASNPLGLGPSTFDS